MSKERPGNTIPSRSHREVLSVMQKLDVAPLLSTKSKREARPTLGFIFMCCGSTNSGESAWLPWAAGLAQAPSRRRERKVVPPKPTPLKEKPRSGGVSSNRGQSKFRRLKVRVTVVSAFHPQ